MRGHAIGTKNDRRDLNLHTVGTCKGITTCGMITMSKKDALRTLYEISGGHRCILLTVYRRREIKINMLIPVPASCIARRVIVK